VQVKMRYVTARPSLADPQRWYWQRPGYPLIRLPDDPAERWGRVEKLNSEADGYREAAPDEGSVAWCVARYRESERFLTRAHQTRIIYERWCRWFADQWGGVRMVDVTPQRIAAFCAERRGTPGARHQAIAVLSNVFDAARFHGIMVENHCHKLRLPGSRRRREYWLPADEEAFLARADDRLRLTFLLLLYTAQRPGDVLAMTWKQWNGTTIKLRQEKTRTLIEVPCHQRLSAALAALTPGSGTITGWPHSGKARYGTFNDAFRACVLAAGIGHLQARDLRRTAVVRMSEAGVTVPRVAAVTGHSIEATQRIIDTYYTRTLPMAEQAIAQWEAAERKQAKG